MDLKSAVTSSLSPSQGLKQTASFPEQFSTWFQAKVHLQVARHLCPQSGLLELGQLLCSGTFVETRTGWDANLHSAAGSNRTEVGYGESRTEATLLSMLHHTSGCPVYPGLGLHLGLMWWMEVSPISSEQNFVPSPALDFSSPLKPVTPTQSSQVQHFQNPENY